MRTWVQFLASLSGMRIWRWGELWCGSQTQLRFGGSGVAVAVLLVGSYSSNSAPGLGISTCCGYGPKTKKKKESMTKWKKSLQRYQKKKEMREEKLKGPPRISQIQITDIPKRQNATKKYHKSFPGTKIHSEKITSVLFGDQCTQISSWKGP